MPEFRICYTRDASTPARPKAINKGVKTVTADDEDDARFKLTALRELRNAKGLRITSVLELV